jgi:hypothetical protein
VVWASQVGGEAQIQRRRSKSGGVGRWAVDDKGRGSEKQARRERLLHEEALACRGVRPARRRLFLDLAETEFKHFGCRIGKDQNLLGIGNC